MIEAVTAYVMGESIYFQLLRFFIVLALGIVFTRAILMKVSVKLFSHKNDKALHSIENLTGVLGIFITFTLALQAGSFGDLVGVLTAIAAAATVAAGFGMRDQVSNLTAGILIHLDNPFIKGDYIKVGDTEGVVKDISMRATQLNGGNNKKQIVPNAMLTTGVVKNYTRDRETKVSIETKVGLKDSEKTSELLLQAIKESKATLDSPEPNISYKKIEENKLEMDATFWVNKASKVKKARSEVLKDYTQKMKDQGLLDEKKDEE